MILERIKKQVDNREENITITYKTKDRNARNVMDQLYGEFNKIVDADEYVKYNVASTKYSIKGYQEAIRLHCKLSTVNQKSKHNM